MKRALGILALGVIASICGQSYTSQTVSGQDHLWIVCALSFPVVSVFSLRVIRQVRGRSYAHRAVLSAVAVYVLSIPVACGLLVQHGNSLLDFHGEYSERAVFVGTTSHLRLDRYFLSRIFQEQHFAIFRLSGQHGTSPSVEISVDQARLAELSGKENTPAIVTLKPGLI